MADTDLTGLAGIGDAQVTVKLRDIRGLEDRIRALELQCAEEVRLRKAAELADPDLARLSHGFDLAMKITCFALGNLPPEQNPGFPHEALLELAEIYRTLPGHTEAPLDGPILWRELARRFEKYARAEARGERAQLVAEEQAAKATGAGFTGDVVNSAEVEVDLAAEATDPNLTSA